MAGGIGRPQDSEKAKLGRYQSQSSCQDVALLYRATLRPGAVIGVPGAAQGSAVNSLRSPLARRLNAGAVVRQRSVDNADAVIDAAATAKFVMICDSH